MQPKALVIAGYGFNADAELAEAFRLAGAIVERIHLSDLLAEPGILMRARILAFPGGFSFGDHLGSGQVVALLCRRSLRSVLEGFVRDGGLVIGICNGFQVLTKMGMLPNDDGSWERTATLIHNIGGSFFDGWTGISFEKDCRSPWVRNLPDRLLPVRHGEGRFYAPEKILDVLDQQGRVALRYSAGQNPNGSSRDIAGICDPSGRVLGLMPHPEAFLIPENHPYRRRGTSDVPGIDLFANGVRTAALSN